MGLRAGRRTGKEFNVPRGKSAAVRFASPGEGAKPSRRRIEETPERPAPHRVPLSGYCAIQMWAKWANL
eukprot:59067-Hanusia_phi.AAC.1